MSNVDDRSSRTKASLLGRLLWMTVGTATRLAAGMATFVLMARMLGPDAFGVVMLWLSAATLLALLGNYGFTPYLLRELGARPQEAARLLGQCLSAKLLLALLLLTAAGLASPWLDASQRVLLLMLLLAQLADGLAEVFNVGLRAGGHFQQEARLTGMVALVQLLMVVAALWVWPTPIGAATGYLLSRAGALVASTWLLRRHVAGVRISPLRQAVQVLRAARAYAVDTVLQSLLGHVDSLAIHHFAGPAAVGVYQAGLRLFNGGAQAAPILANVLLPQAAAAYAVQGTGAGTGARFSAEAVRLQWSFLGVGALFGLVLAWAAEPLAHGLFGSRFGAVALVLPWLGVLFHLRFFAASWGVVLTAMGAQKFRAQANLLMWALVAVLTPLLLPRWGLAGWVMALLAGHAWLAAAYVWRGRHAVGSGHWWQPAVGVLLALCFLPWLTLDIAP